MRHVLFCHFLKRIISHPSIEHIHSDPSTIKENVKHQRFLEQKEMWRFSSVHSLQCEMNATAEGSQHQRANSLCECSPKADVDTLVALCSCEKKSHKRRSEQLSRCSFSAFSTSVYSKADARSLLYSFHTFNGIHQSATRKRSRLRNSSPLSAWNCSKR